LAQARRHPGLNRAGRAALALCVAASHGFGCGSGARGGDALARRFPEVEAVRGQRLNDANPYVLPHDGRVRFFHCHWNTATPVAVSLPPDANDAERRALEAALEAWEGAGLGVRFERVDAVSRGIEIRFVGGTIDTAAGQDTANTVVDCAIAPLSQQRGADVAGAELVLAKIRIARITNPDTQGHQRPLSEAELAGTALHELGHALGFQGHARQGDTVMVRETERIARAGKTLLAGGGFSDASVRALYRLPSGAAIGGGAIDRCRSDHVDRMARLAEQNGLAGPFVRVGESAGRIFWRDVQGLEYGLVLARLREARRDPAALVVLSEGRVRRALAPGRDLHCAEGS
jgi:Matrixin